jgi:hypothetical protein
MTAAAGTDPTNWRDGVGLFGTGTPLAAEVGIETVPSTEWVRHRREQERQHRTVRGDRQFESASSGGESILTSARPRNRLRTPRLDGLLRVGIAPLKS